MCGIAGIFHFETKMHRNDLSSHLSAMLGTLKHRGPETQSSRGGGLWSLGITRLAIIDLANSDNVFSARNNRVHYVVNGEIFNHQELRKELSEKGYTFRSSCDSEVVGFLYEEHGPDFIHRLNGQYAIILYDEDRREVYLFRDRFGIIPLYYTLQKGSLYVASEIKGFLPLKEIPREFDDRALDQLFTFWTTIGGTTFLKNVSCVRHGTYLRISGAGVVEHRYYDLGLEKDKIDPDLSFEKAKDLLREILFDSVKLRLTIADVDVGTYLSGGLDSSIITKIAASIHKEGSLKTYSIIFSDPSYSEEGYQDVFFNSGNLCRHQTNIEYRDIVQTFPEAVWHAEQPVFRTAPIPLFKLSELVNGDGLKVVLTGEGADEVFWGYDIFRELKIRKFWARNPASTVRPRLFTRLYAYLPQYDDKYQAFISEFYRKTLLDEDPDFYSHAARFNNGTMLKIFFSDDLKETLRGYSCIEDLRALLPGNFDRFSDYGKTQYLEMETLLPGYLLSSQGDRMSMAHSVESRIPFLDHRLVEFAATLPESYKLKSLVDKHILRETYRDVLPETIRRRAKHAYQAPEMKGFEAFAADGYVEHFLSEKVVKDIGIFNPRIVARLYRKLLEGSRSGRFSTRDNMAFVQILSTHLFYSRFIQN